MLFLCMEETKQKHWWLSVAVLVSARLRKDTFSMLPEKTDGLFVTNLQISKWRQNQTVLLPFSNKFKKAVVRVTTILNVDIVTEFCGYFPSAKRCSS